MAVIQKRRKRDTRAGRPRDPRLDDAILDAALQVFLEDGFHKTSLSEIARRANVGTPAIYRRWQSKADIAIDLVVREAEPQPIPDSGSVRRDLATFLRQRIDMFGGRLFHYVMIPVLSDPDLSASIRARFLAYRAPLEERIDRAITAGELRSDADAGRLIDMLMGTILMPLLFSAPMPHRSDAGRIVDSVLEGFAAGK